MPLPDDYPMIPSPGDWFPRGIATDCLWYEQFQGNEMCEKLHIQLGLDDEPCFLCKHYKEFKGGPHEKDYAQNLVRNSGYPVDRNGKYYFDGMWDGSEKNRR